jgi:hypothetical protein
MTHWKTIASAALLFVSFLPAQPGAQEQNEFDVNDRVLNVIFPLNVESKPYFVKLIVRFRDDPSQLALVVYPGGQSELIRSSPDGMHGSDYSLFIKKLTENPNANEAEIAAKVGVHTTRFPVQYKTVEPMLNELKAIRISPFLATRVGVDDVTLYEFWFDSGQESVHYRIFDDAGSSDPQDKLAQWIARFRKTFPKITNTASR